MVLSGTMTAINGLIAILNDKIIVVGEQHIVAFDVTVWGWIHLILGIVVVMAAFALLNGAVWARLVAAIMSVGVVLSQVAYIGVYPFWSLAIIAISVMVIYSVCTMGRADEEIELPI